MNIQLGKPLPSYLLAIGMISLALALTYFTLTLAKVAAGIPKILEGVQETQERLNPLLEEVAQIRELVPPIIAEVGFIREEIPNILTEVASIREQIPSILEETEAYREQIPSILEQVDNIQNQIPSILTEVENVRETIPTVLAQVDSIQQQIPTILEEVEQLRETTIPEILTQVDGIREEVPEILDDVGEIVSNLDTTIAKASEGAGKGFLTGLIKAPMSIVTGFGANLIQSGGLSEEDIEIIKAEAITLLSTGKRRDKRTWSNPKTNFNGTLTIRSEDNRGLYPCMVLRITVNIGKTKKAEEDVPVCKDADGNWVIPE